MKELLEYSFSTINIIPTGLLIFILLYWLIVILGFIGTDAIDVDLDIDANVDMDVDVDTDIDVDAGGANIFISALDFFNVGRVPLMVLLSFIALPLWFIVLNVNDFLGIETFALAAALLIPEFFISLLIAKILTNPLAKMFKKIDTETGTPTDFTGKIAEVRVWLDKTSDGQIALDHKGATVVLTARSIKNRIEQNKKVLIIDYIEKEQHYIVEEFND